MNFDKLFAWVAGIVLLFAAAGHIDDLQRWIWRAQARALYESRTATWGNPSIFKCESKQPAKLEENQSPGIFREHKPNK